MSEYTPMTGSTRWLTAGHRDRSKPWLSYAIEGLGQGYLKAQTS